MEQTIKYKLAISEYAKKQLKKLDRHTFTIITNWMLKNLENCENPRLHGKALTANRVGQWRYRVGDYRILAEIRDSELIILVIEVGHRSKIYK